MRFPIQTRTPQPLKGSGKWKYSWYGRPPLAVQPVRFEGWTRKIERPFLHTSTILTQWNQYNHPLKLVFLRWHRRIFRSRLVVINLARRSARQRKEGILVYCHGYSATPMRFDSDRLIALSANERFSSFPIPFPKHKSQHSYTLFRSKDIATKLNGWAIIPVIRHPSSVIRHLVFKLWKFTESYRNTVGGNVSSYKFILYPSPSFRRDQKIYMGERRSYVVYALSQKIHLPAKEHKKSLRIKSEC